MFIFGLIVGMIVGAVAWMGLCVAICAKRFGSLSDFVNGVDLLHDAADNRESTLQVYHKGELLNEVVFKEL